LSVQTTSSFAAEYSIPFGLPQQSTREWFAIFTRYQTERSVIRHLEFRQLEAFLPNYEVVHRWKNGQRKTIVAPLFPSYVFVRMQRSERGTVLKAPGVVRIVGSSTGPSPIPDQEIGFLRSDYYKGRLEPFSELLIGERVRIAQGPMMGVEGTLIRRKNNSLRFVLSVETIRQYFAVEVQSEDLEPIR
jgi:transcription antitermination factor NusG